MRSWCREISSIWGPRGAGALNVGRALKNASSPRCSARLPISKRCTSTRRSRRFRTGPPLSGAATAAPSRLPAVAAVMDEARDTKRTESAIHGRVAVDTFQYS